jgi:hypothetical protein
VDVTATPQEELEALGRRLAQEHGFRFRPAPYFATSGILVCTPPVDAGAFAVIERSVFLYSRENRWEARVTQHGGAHWIRVAETIARLEVLALEALQTEARPPTSAWRPA